MVLGSRGRGAFGGGAPSAAAATMTRSGRIVHCHRRDTASVACADDATLSAAYGRGTP
jgi:hypothetical protein